MHRFQRNTPKADSSGPAAPSEVPRWLTFRCVRCGARVYGGFTASALERKLREEPGIAPDFFHADCGVETTLDQAQLEFEDGEPWKRPA